MKKPRSYAHLPIDEQFTKAYTRGLKFLSYRPRSEKEISDFLTKKGFDALVIQKTIELLREQKLVNEKEFAEWWTDQRQTQRAKSKQFIKLELRQKGVDQELIEEVVENSQDDYKTAKEYFEKRKKRFEQYRGDEYFQKAAAFLQRRGFSWDVVKRVLKRGD